MNNTNETWDDVPGYDGMYQVSTLGNVKSMRRWVERPNSGGYWINEKPMRLSLNKATGYLQLALSSDGVKTTFRVHSLIAETFIGPIRSGYCVHHKNWDKTDNRVENLEIQKIPDFKHACLVEGKHGHGVLKGQQNKNSKLTELNIRDIRKMLSDGATQKEVAKKFNVSKSLIGYIKNNSIWSHVC